MNFTCSAGGKPAVDTYQLFENDTLVSDGSNSHGMWNRTMSVGGVFIYKCLASNTVGTGQSESVIVAVNGKQATFNVNVDASMVLVKDPLSLTMMHRALFIMNLSTNMSRKT